LFFLLPPIILPPIIPLSHLLSIQPPITHFFPPFTHLLPTLTNYFPVFPFIYFEAFFLNLMVVLEKGLND
jgi:hypothetical protein